MADDGQEAAEEPGGAPHPAAAATPVPAPDRGTRLSADFDDPWVQVDGQAEVLDLPEALEPLVEYFRSISGEHPDWDEYRAAMTRQGKSLLRITLTGWGPVATGGFPPEMTSKL